MYKFNREIFHNCRQVFLDLALAIGSFAVIGLFICIQTGSLWIAGFALFGILLSFVEANIIYRVILDYRCEISYCRYIFIEAQVCNFMYCSFLKKLLKDTISGKGHWYSCFLASVDTYMCVLVNDLCICF